MEIMNGLSMNRQEMQDLADKMNKSVDKDHE